MILSEIAILCLRENASHIIVGGDFNTDFSKENLSNGQMLRHFLKNESLENCVDSTISSVDYTYYTQTRLGQLGTNISPDRSSLTPQVLIGNFLKHNYPLLYELHHINLLCLYLPKEDGVSPDAEYITQIIFSIFLQ